MKKIAIALTLCVSTIFSEQFVLDNKTSYPEKNQKIAIEWANSAKEVDTSNKSLSYDAKLGSDAILLITSQGKTEIKVPEKATYFRIVAWSKKEGAPDFSTNWIDIVPGKTYTLTTDHLVPVVLMVGMGC